MSPTSYQTAPPRVDNCVIQAKPIILQYVVAVKGNILKYLNLDAISHISIKKMSCILRSFEKWSLRYHPQMI